MKNSILTLTFATLFPLTGLTQENSSQKEDLQYEEIKKFSDAINVRVVRLNGRWRLLNNQTQQPLTSDGKLIIYDKVEQIKKSPYLTATSKGHSFLLDANGKIIPNVTDFDEITAVDKSTPPRYLGINKADKNAVLDVKKGKITDFIYDHIPFFFSVDKPRIIFRKNRLYGVLDSELNEILPAIVNMVDSRKSIDWLKNVDIHGNVKWGAVINGTGLVIPPENIRLYFDKKNIFAQKNKSYLEILDIKDGKKLKSINFTVADIPYTDDDSIFYFTTLKNGNAGIVDVDGKVIIPHHYDNFLWVDTEPNNLFFAKKGGYYGLIDTNQTVYVPFEYEYLTWYNEEQIILAEKNAKWKFLTIKGSALCDWQDGVVAWQFEKEFFILKSNDLRKKGLIDKQCKTIIPSQFHRIEKKGDYFFGFGEFIGESAVYSKTGKLLAKDFLDHKLSGTQLEVYGKDKKWHLIETKALTNHSTVKAADTKIEKDKEHHEEPIKN